MKHLVMKLLYKFYPFWKYNTKYPELKRYAELIIQKYSWEIKNGNITDLQDQLDLAQYRLNIYIGKCDTLQEYYDDEKEKNKNEFLRFEQEVIHLKDLVQEKNIVIDKLIKQLNGNKL